MYCKKCGRYIDNDSPLCYDCEAEEKANTEEPEIEEVIEEVAKDPVTEVEEIPSADESKIPTGMAFKPTHVCENPYLDAQTTVESGKVLQTSEIKIEIAENPVPKEDGDKDTEEKPSTGNRMHGFGPALTGVILGLVASIIDSVTGYVTGVSSLLTILADLAGNSELSSNFTTGGIAANIVIGFICLAFSIVTLSLGAKSVKTFKLHKNTTGTKALPTLILGIAGIVIGAYGIIGFLDNIIVLFVYLGMDLVGSAIG